MSIEVTLSWWERAKDKPESEWEPCVVRRKVRARKTRVAQSREIAQRFLAILRSRLAAGMEIEEGTASYPLS